jgi:hypothetical protein
MTQEWEEREELDRIGEPGLEEPDADAAEQRRPLVDNDATEPTEQADEPLPEDADEADVLDQRRIVPAEDDDYVAPE